MDLKQLSQLPSPFYRVTVKALIFDNQSRLLVGLAGDGWEMPGGGLEHQESITECVSRELGEELGAKVENVGNISFMYRGKSVHGWMIVRIAVPVKLKNFNFKYGDMKDSKFVTRDELLRLDFAADEGTIKDCVDLIWPK